MGSLFTLDENGLHLGTLLSTHITDSDFEGPALIYAISIDDMRNASKIKPLVNSKGWEYEVYHDSNSEFAAKMGVKPIPHTFLFDGNKQIVWNHPGYTEGDEDKLFEKILEITE